jgi:Tfp pilus assembly protein PilV
MRTSRKRHWGFGLIEILVTLGVLSVGIVGVTVLQSTVTRQSSENKSRAEALAIAQSRIEEMRNYTGDVKTLAGFNLQFPTSNDFGNSFPVTGTNAAFTREEQIGASGELRTVAVRVTWTDGDGVSQSVNLNTQLSYISPRSIGDTALEAATSVVDSPTGRARLGDGELPADVELSDLAHNGDLTYLYDQGTERMLVTADKDIVLTLEEACQTEQGTCIDFVRIKGRVYIDRTSQGSLPPGEVHVVASDAAYCSRYWTTTSGQTTTVHPVTNTTTSTITTGNGTNGSYTYFDYTCYIGGGWHGNIGILLADGLGNADKICVGDPVTSDAWATPIIASRRVYRGMLYKPAPSSSTTIQVNGATVAVESYVSSTGATVPRFYSQGIADSIELPAAGDKTHDFVIGSFQANKTDGSYCETEGVMTRTDSATGSPAVVGALFSNVPTDFVCLNGGLLDDYDTGIYANSTTCPYDPSDPPSSSHTVSGSITLTASDTADHDVIAATIKAETSDGLNNCTMTTAATPNAGGTAYVATYICDVYDWGNGWNGYIEADYDAAEMECDPYQLTKTAMTTNSTGNNFTNCTTGSFAVVSGTVTASGSRKLSTVAMGTDGACTVAANGLSFECISTEYTGPTKTFSITFTANSGVVCRPSAPHSISYTRAFTNQPAGNATPLVIKIASNGNGC